jgi:hypothetical protein
MRNWIPVRLSAVVIAALVVARCSSSSTPSTPTPTPTPTPTGPAVTTVVTGVQAADGTAATQQSGTPPAASGGPTVTAATSTAIVPGGSDIVTLQSATPFQSVYVSVPTAPGLAPASFDPNRLGSLAAANGYFLLRLPAPVTNAVVISSLASTLSTGATFTLAYSVANASGAIGPTVTSTKTAIGSTGNVQVNVTWNTATDVDLHVVDPRNEEIYYLNQRSASGGSLDVDSNAGCSIDNKNSENIRWGTTAPNGQYIVRVDYWSACNVTGTTTYTVVVNNGGATSRFTGTFSPSNADSGGQGAGREITRFNHTTGIAPFSIVNPVYVDPPFLPSVLKRLSQQQ